MLTLFLSSSNEPFDLVSPIPHFKGVWGELFPPLLPYLLKIMSRKNHQNRASRAHDKRVSLTRHNCLDTPVWLLLYWLDLRICSSSFLSRRSLLRVRNTILDMLGVPSGDAWYVQFQQTTKDKHESK